MIWILVVVGVLVILGLALVVSYNRFVAQRQLDPERLGQHRHRAAPPVRPHPEPRRDRQGLREPRARGVRGGHPGPVRGDGRHRVAGAAGRGRRAARGRPAPAVRGRRELPRPEGEPELPGPAGRAVEHRGPHPGQPALLQRQRAGLQPARAVLPVDRIASMFNFKRGGVLRDRGGPAADRRAGPSRGLRRGQPPARPAPPPLPLRPPPRPPRRSPFPSPRPPQPPRRRPAGRPSRPRPTRHRPSPGPDRRGRPSFLPPSTRATRLRAGAGRPGAGRRSEDEDGALPSPAAWTAGRRAGRGAPGASPVQPSWTPRSWRTSSPRGSRSSLGATGVSVDARKTSGRGRRRVRVPGHLRTTGRRDGEGDPERRTGRRDLGRRVASDAHPGRPVLGSRAMMA